MKQKRIGDILYVFDVTPYTISEDTDASIIKVQQECYEGFVELNPDLASKIVKYNYHMFTVNKQEWSDYVDQPDPEPELPAPGTVYNFTGYATEGSSEPTSTGTITYEGEWEQDANYVYGTASATFVGSEEVQSVTVYMTKDDLFLSLDGNRVPVYTIQSDQLVSFGYGELTEYTE